MTKVHDVFRYRECGESLGTVPGSRQLTTAAPSLPILKVKGDLSILIKSRQQWPRVPFELCVLENAIIQRKRPLVPQNPTGSVLIQLQPFTILTQDFSGRNSLKLLQRKSHKLLQSQRDVPVLHWVKSQLPVTLPCLYILRE